MKLIQVYTLTFRPRQVKTEIFSDLITMNTSSKRQEPVRAPQQRRSEERVAQILEAGKINILKKGCAGLKMSDIATTAGISISSIYQYFPNKQAIVEALARHYLEAFRVNAITALQQAPDNLDAVWTTATELLDANYEMHRDDPVVRDIFKGSASDKALHEIEEQDRAQSLNEFIEVSKHLFKPSQHTKLKQTMALFFDFGHTAVARAVELDEEAGKQHIALAKQLLSYCWEGSIKPLAKASSK